MGAIHLYKFNNNSNDYIGSDNGTKSAPVTYVSGGYTKCAYFSGVNSAQIDFNVNLFYNLSEFTISVELVAHGFIKEGGLIIGDNQTWGEWGRWMIFIGTSSTGYAGFWCVANSTSYSNPKVINVNKRTTIIYSFKNNNYSGTMVDGSYFENAYPTLKNTSGSTRYTRIGNIVNTYTNFNGNLWRLEIFNSALSLANQKNINTFSKGFF